MRYDNRYVIILLPLLLVWGLISTKSTQYYLLKGIYNNLYFFIEVWPVCAIPSRKLKSWRTPFSIVVSASNFPGMYSPYFLVKSRSGNLVLNVWSMLYIITVAFYLASSNVVDGKCYICYKKFLINHIRTIIIRIEQLLLHSTIYTTIVCQSHRPNYLQSVTTQLMQSVCKKIYSISTLNMEEMRLL